MMVAVLLGALSLGACVDDNESASVTAIRDAQAAKLNALADLYSAQAEAESIRAAAEADYKAALAEYQRAKAAWQDAQTAEAEFNLQKARDEYERNLEAINLEAQNRLLQAQLEAQSIEMQFLTLLNNQLAELYDAYATELSELQGYQSQLNSQKNLLEQYKLSLISQQAYVARQTNLWKENIADYQAQINAYNAYEGLDWDDLNDQMTTIRLQRSNANQTYIQKQQQTLTAQQAYNKVINTFVAGEEGVTLKTVLAVETLQDLGFYNIYTEPFVIDEENNLSVNEYFLNGEEAVVIKRQNLASALESAQTTLGKEAVGETDASGLYLQLENAKKDLADAEKAENESDINYWTREIARINDEIAEAKVNVAEAEQDVKDFEAAIASFSGTDLTAYENALKALQTNETVVAYVEAIKAEDKAKDTYDELDAQYYVLNDLRNASVDAQNQIATLQQNIDNLNEQIAQLSTLSQERLVQQAEDEIARLEARIEAQQAVVDLAKKNLDNAIAAQGSEEEQPAA